MGVLLKMASVTLYPVWDNNSRTGMRNVDGNTGIYREMEDIQVLADTTYNAHWGSPNPGAGYINAVASKNGGRHKPSQIEVWNFNLHENWSKIPAKAKITSLRVNYAHGKFAYASMGHGSFAQPIISIPKFNLHAQGNAPPADVIQDYSVKFDNLNIPSSELADARVTFDLPMNTSDYPAYVQMKYLSLTVEYIAANYIPSIDFEPNIIQYGQESTVTVEVNDTNKAVSTDNILLYVTVSDGLSIVPGSIQTNGSFDTSTWKWNARIVNGKCKLTFRVTPASPAVAGNQSINAFYYYEPDKYHKDRKEVYIVPQTASLLECSISQNSIKQSLPGGTRYYARLTVTVQNNARTPLEVYLDLDELSIQGSLPGYNPETKILTITEWDANNIYDKQIQIYSTVLRPQQVICKSNAWTGVTKIDLEVAEPWDYDPVYAQLDAPLFTYENMYRTDGEEYVFGCLVRLKNTTVDYIVGSENRRASVVNGNEYFTKRVSQIGEWELLMVRFKYDESSQLSFRFYGDYKETSQGNIEFGNIFIIHSSHFEGYEYPVLSFDDLGLLINNTGEYANLLLEPPEKNPCTKHYFDLMDWQGLSESPYLIPHGIEITGQIHAEEKVSLLLGFGHKDMDELDYYLTSLNIDSEKNTFKFGGKFETLGLRFPDIASVLDDLVFYLVVDDSFDNATPLNVQMKNVQIKLYYSLDNYCWEFFVNGVSSKYFLLDLMADSEIPRGANYDVNKFKVDGADGEFPNRINLEENKLKLKFTTCECGTIEDLSPLLEKVVEWLYPERDSLDNPQLKTISFFYAPDVGYDYYIEDTMDAEAVDGAYECEVELIVPSGLAHNILETTGSIIGHTGHMGKVKPVILFNLLPDNNTIMLVESATNQKLTLAGEFIESLPANTLMKLDCQNKKLYYQAYGEWFSIDPNVITLDSVFFTIAGYYDFSDSVGVKIADVKYHELKG